MNYIFDSSPLIVLFRHFYPDRFPALWKRFKSLVDKEKILSVRDVSKEIQAYANVDRLVEWR